MDITKQVTEWVEKKFGKIISKDLKIKIQDEDSNFNVESYAHELFKTYLQQNDLQKIQEEIFSSRCISKSEISNINSLSSSTSSLYSLELEPNEFKTISVDDLIKNLNDNSKEVQIKSLELLENSSDELINQTSWGVIKKILQHFLLKSKGDIKTRNLVLKIFHKIIFCPNKPQIVCDGFISLAEVISFHIELTNSGHERISFEEIYDLKKEEWLNKKEKEVNDPHDMKIHTEVLIKSMWLLIECQKQMPEKWIRFNERRLREIIFSFVHLLYSTSNLENEKLTGLELISILNPTASWCRHWCHTSVGRSLLCSALRKYKSFLIRVVEIILFYMKAKKKKILEDSDLDFDTEKEIIHFGNERIKCVRSAPTVKINSSRKVTETIFRRVFNIPSKIVAQATFFHCVSLVVCLIQYRSGRALFPIQTSSRKRLLNVQDLTSSISNYLENSEFLEGEHKGINFTREYKHQILEMTNVLKIVKYTINSSRKSGNRLPSCS